MTRYPPAAGGPHGWIILDKPRGLGSTQAVSAVKRNLREAGFNMKLKGGLKVGHGGTLDPLAEGVLPIALGEATKLCGRMLDATKMYTFTVTFGEETDTLDAEGKVIATSIHRPTQQQVDEVLARFRGEIEQIPPAYSALMVNGQRAYDLARAGEHVEMRARKVTIHELFMSHWDRGWDDTEFSSLTLGAIVSKGTYIRSLARDIAYALGTVGYVTMLRRDRVGPFTQAQAISLDLLNEIGKGAPLEDHLLPLEAGLDGIPALTLDPESAQAVRQGRVISGLPNPDGLYLAKLGADPVALLEIDGGSATVVRGFNV